ISRFGDPRPFAPLGAQLKVYDANGAEGGLTGRYYRGDELVVTKTEADPDYQYLPADQFMRDPPVRGAFPAEFNNQSPTRVTWEGAVEANAAGVHKFQVYASSYIKVWVDGRLVVDRWRQNWNPWTYNFDLQMAPGEKHAVKIEWLPNDG